MRRAAIGGAIAVALVAAAVAVGAGTDVRIHRLHLPPPPVGDDTTAPGKPSPTAPPAPPGTTSPPPAPSPPGTQPSPPPPPSAVGCTSGGDVSGAAVTGTLNDYSIALSAPSVASAPTLVFRGAYGTGVDVHNFTLRNSSLQTLCGTTNLTSGAASFTVTNLPPGSYELFCTFHVGIGMRVPFTVN